MMGIGICNSIGGGGGAAKPPAILYDGNTVAWYDSSDLTTITKDGSNLISLWKDKLGSGHDLTSTGTAKPLHTSEKTVLFDGINDAMTSAFVYGQPEYMYLILRCNSQDDLDAFMDGAVGNTCNVRVHPTGLLNIYMGSAWISGTAGTITTGNYFILRIRINGINSSFSVNDSLHNISVAATGSMGGISIGRNGSFTFANIEVAEIIMRKVADDSPSETAIYNYLKKKIT